jgi:thioredoxin reductase (NADPH)
MDLAEIEERGGLSREDVPAISADLRDLAVGHEGHAGGPRADAESETEETANADD